MSSRRRRTKKSGKRVGDPRRRWSTTITKDVPPGPQGQPAHQAGEEIQVVQVVTHPELGRVGFVAPSPARLLMSAASPRVKRAMRLQLQLPSQTTERGFIKPFMDRRFTSDRAVLDFFEEAMAAVLLLHAALDSYANESMPEGLTVSWKGQTLSRDDLEQRGIKLRLTVALPAALGKESLETARAEVWQRVAELKDFRDDIAHIKSADVYSNTPTSETLFSRLLVADLHEFASAVEQAMEHYGQAPRVMPSRPGTVDAPSDAEDGRSIS